MNKENFLHNRRKTVILWAALVVLMLAYMLSVFHRLTISIMADKLVDDLGLNALQLGLLSSIYFYPYAFANCLSVFYPTALGPYLINIVGLNRITTGYFLMLLSVGTQIRYLN